MAKNDLLKRLLDSGMQFTAMSQSRAESIAKELVKQGEVRKKETEHLVATLMDRGRESAERIGQLVEEEVGRQVARLAAQLDDLEARLTSITGIGGSAPGAPEPSTAARSTKKAGRKAAAVQSAAEQASPAKRAKKAVPTEPVKRAKKAAAAEQAEPVKRAKQAAPAKKAAPTKRAAPVKRASRKAAAEPTVARTVEVGTARKRATKQTRPA